MSIHRRTNDTDDRGGGNLAVEDFRDQNIRRPKIRFDCPVRLPE